VADRKLFTDKFLEALKPAPKGQRYYRWDSKVEHFGVRVTDTGRVSFVVMKRPPGGGNVRTETIGAYGDMTLAKARELAGQALDLLAERKSLRAELRAREEAEVAEAAKRLAETKELFENVATEYKAHIASPRRYPKPMKPRTQEEVWRPFRNLFIPAWGTRHIATVTRQDIKELLNRVAKRGIGVAANRAKTVLSGFYTWAINEGHAQTSPVAGMPIWWPSRSASACSPTGSCA
jgi:hypothetical protein